MNIQNIESSFSKYSICIFIINLVFITFASCLTILCLVFREDKRLIVVFSICAFLLSVIPIIIAFTILVIYIKRRRQHSQLMHKIGSENSYNSDNLLSSEMNTESKSVNFSKPLIFHANSQPCMIDQHIFNSQSHILNNNFFTRKLNSQISSIKKRPLKRNISSNYSRLNKKQNFSWYDKNIYYESLSQGKYLLRKSMPKRTRSLMNIHSVILEKEDDNPTDPREPEFKIIDSNYQISPVRLSRLHSYGGKTVNGGQKNRDQISFFWPASDFFSRLFSNETVRRFNSKSLRSQLNLNESNPSEAFMENHISQFFCRRLSFIKSYRSRMGNSISRKLSELDRSENKISSALDQSAGSISYPIDSHFFIGNDCEDKFNELAYQSNDLNPQKASVFSLPAISPSLWRLDTPIYILHEDKTLAIDHHTKKIYCVGDFWMSDKNSLLALHAIPPPRCNLKQSAMLKISQNTNKKCKSLGHMSQITEDNNKTLVKELSNEPNYLFNRTKHFSTKSFDNSSSLASTTNNILNCEESSSSMRNIRASDDGDLCKSIFE